MNAKITNMFNKVRLGVDNYKPEIFLAGSIASGIACVVTACKATGKSKEMMAEYKKAMEKKDETIAEFEKDPDVRPVDKARFTVGVYLEQIKEFAKVWGIPVALGILSVTCSLASYGILRNRNISLAVANAGLAATIESYRGRVANAVGKDKEQDLYFGIEEEEITQPVTGPDGKEKQVKKKVKTCTGQSPIYTFDFNEDTSTESQGDVRYDTDFIGMVQEQLNRDLKKNGFVFLNDALKLLGMKIVDYGQDVGWLHDPYHNDRGDNEVEILVLETTRELIGGGRKSSIKINFNCDGNIRNDVYNWIDYDSTGMPSGEVA